MSRWKPKTEQERASHQDTAGQTETFWTRNVRTITFTACILAFLVVFIPIGVIGYSVCEDWLDGSDKRPEITAADLVTLSEKQGGIYLSDLTVFRGELQETELDAVYVMEFGQIHLRAVANKSNQRIEVFSLFNRESGERLDVLKDDLRAYFSNGKK
ncbi:MAG: hypothetical protein IKB75_04285 [Clostridia bacterium]|nr:hypothetical protein [Clostridia bacterium]